MVGGLSQETRIAVAFTATVVKFSGGLLGAKYERGSEKEDMK